MGVLGSSSRDIGAEPLAGKPSPDCFHGHAGIVPDHPSNRTNAKRMDSVGPAPACIDSGVHLGCIFKKPTGAEALRAGGAAKPPAIKAGAKPKSLNTCS